MAQDLGEDLSEEEIQHMFTKADLDDDGFVTAEDFYNIMTHRVYWDGRWLFSLKLFVNTLFLSS